MTGRESKLNAEKELAHFLAPLGLAAWQFHPVVGSTNDIARGWAKMGAPDWALVIADRQTKGRGRNERKWITQGGAGLAFSMVIKATHQEMRVLPRFTALAALGLIHALSKFCVGAEIKWPNDVLLNGKKAAGVLVEAEWQEDELEALVVGIGVNVKQEAVPPADVLRYPATSVEEVLGMPINRWELLALVIEEMQALRPSIRLPEFIEVWNAHLAFRGEVVPIKLPNGDLKEMKIVGVMGDGKLELRDTQGEGVELAAGEILMQK